MSGVPVRWVSVGSFLWPNVVLTYSGVHPESCVKVLAHLFTYLLSIFLPPYLLPTDSLTCIMFSADKWLLNTDNDILGVVWTAVLHCCCAAVDDLIAFVIVVTSRTKKLIGQSKCAR